MASEPSPADSVLKAEGDAVLDEWRAFLIHPDIGCQLSSVKADSGSDVTCTFTPFWNYVFDSSTNKALFGTVNSDVGNGVILAGLKTASTAPSLLEILHQFGVVGPDNEVPSDDGTHGTVTTSTQPAPLMQSLVDCIGKTSALQILQTGLSKTERNAAWFTPGTVLRTDIVLTFGLGPGAKSVLQSMADTIKTSFNVSLTPNNEDIDFKIQLQKTLLGVKSGQANATSGSPGGIAWNVNSSYKMTFLFAVGASLFSITLLPSGLDFSVTQNPDSTEQASLLSMIGQNTLSSDLVFDQVLSGVEILKASVHKDVSSGVYWEITVGLAWSKVGVYLSYDSLSAIFTGGLILQDFYALESDKLLPDYQTGQVIVAPTGYVPRYFWDIKDLSDDFKSIPSVFPTTIVMATVSFSANPTQLWFSAKLISPPTLPNPQDPQVPAPFTWDELDVSFSKSASSFSCNLSTNFTLEAPTRDAFADLGLYVSFTGGDWLLMGYAENLTGAMLFQFFEESFKDALTAVLGPLSIPTLQVVYTYANGGAASSFAFLGVVQLGQLQLRMLYQYASSDAGTNTAASQALPPDQKSKAIQVQPVTDPNDPKVSHAQTDWRFECDLGAAPGPGVNLGSVIDSLVQGGASSLPTFLTNIPFPAAGTDTSLISIKVAKDDSEKADGSILFAFRITLDGFSFSFAQIGATGTTKAKQVLRFAVDALPVMKEIPLIDTLPQPFDQLEYMWVSDVGGIMESEAASLNKLVLGTEDSLFYRRIVGQAANKNATGIDSVVLVPGHHFMVIKDKEAIIDHVFATATPTVPQTISDGQPQDDQLSPGAVPTADVGTNTGGADPTPPTPAASPPSKGSLDFTIGPLSISAVALQYKEQAGEKSISVTMDATFAMGPVTFALLGFGFAIPMDKITLHDFSSLSVIKPVISGLSLGFDQPPLLIAGGFEHKTIGSLATNDFQDIYLGGIGISWPPYTFVGLGEYAILENYKSVFLYAKLDGPLVTLEFATISGIRLGFGYNSAVRSPLISELTVFPFINDGSSSTAGDNPLQIVKNMTQASNSAAAWVSPKQDSYWFAAGMTVSAFDVLTITAVAMLAFQPAGVVVSIYADAVAQMPPDAKSTSEMIVYVELGLVAEMNFIEGYFRVEAALAPTSFLLVKECHLYGGFALVYWFGSNPHAGDWVFSVGGYHPQYQKPDWYPAVQRLGISWSPGACMSITGEAYFAVTPKVVMGGAMIRVTLSVGPVHAWLEASFDCLINFHPLHYRADFSVSVGVSFDMDFWFIHIHIECSVGAWLTVQGPDFGGTAHVDFYLFGFDVDFGSSPGAKPAMRLIEFWSMLHQPGPIVDSQNATDPDRLRPHLMLDENVNPDPKVGPIYKPYNPPDGSPIEGAAFKYVLEDGNFTMTQRKGKASPNAPAAAGTGNNAPASSAPTSTGAGAKWFVKGGSFKFRISTDFALSHASVQAGDNGDGDAVDVMNPNVTPSAADQKVHTGIYSRPMRVDQDMTSELVVKIYKKSGGHVVGGWTNGSFDIKAVPQATFGKYSTDTDPMQSDAGSLLSHDNATMPLGMGLKLEAPLPFLAPSSIPVFKAEDAAVLGVEDFRYKTDGDHWYLPVYTPLAEPNFADPPPAPPLPDMVPLQSVYIPSELTTAEEVMSPQQRWDEVGAQWTQIASSQKAVAVGLITAVSEMFQWEQGWQVKLGVLSGSGGAPVPAANVASLPQQGAPTTTAPPTTQTIPARQPWQLVSDFPAKMVRDFNKKGDMVKNLELTYLDLPRMAVAV